MPRPRNWLARLAIVGLATLTACPAALAAPPAARTGVLMYADPSLPGHTLYRPRSAGRVAHRLPIVAWANGGCATVGNRYRHFLQSIADKGFLVIAIGTIGAKRYENVWAAEPFQPKGPPQPTDPANSDSSELTKAIDWAIVQDGLPGSRLYHRLDTRRIAVMGHSCGGLQALAVSTDPRVTTTVLLNSGVWNTGSGGLPGADVSKATLGRLHAPIAYISGDASDMAFANANDDFARIDGVPALRAYRHGSGHTAMYWSGGRDDFARVTGAWLRWRLLDDDLSARMFVGARCGLCRDPHWTVARKRLER